ncbi:unnamed protein product [Rotaria magnacalcarata]|nr:unnamed protein product [Rotaria magnacalcarata]CAF4926928.1 unnamed protein product [Rotaria magnacalcarata]
MAASFDSNLSVDSLKPQQISPSQSTVSESSIAKKTLTLEEKERMIRENDQTQRMKSQSELISERKTVMTPMSNIPLMTMTPISATSNTSSAFFKDLTSTLFEQTSPQPSYGVMSSSQTMPSLARPTLNNLSSPMQPQSKPPPMNFTSPSPSSTTTTDLTSSLMNNINFLASRPQTSPNTMSLNSMNSNMNSFMSLPMNSSGASLGGMQLFQPPPSGSIVVKSTNVTSSKTAAAELDDLFN